MIFIGVDPHKRTHTASAVDAATNAVVATVQIDASLAGYRQLVRWSARFEKRRWAVENARGLGRHLAQWLAARGEAVEDVPSTATARVRELSRGGRRKYDVIDAAAAASVAALHGEANPVLVEDSSTVLAMLDERRDNLVTQRTRLVNQLHALLRDLLPGGAGTDLTAAGASRLLAGIRPAGPVEVTRKQVARELVGEIRDADQRITATTKQIALVVNQTGSRLTQVDGIGPVIAGRLLGRTRHASRFPTSAAFASYAGVAPVEAASGDRARHRLPRTGDRQLNLALHIVALSQVRMRSSAGRAYYDTKINAGKRHNEAMRCLKRRLADHVWRLMIQDERRSRTGPGGQPGATTNSSATGSTPNASSSEKSLPGPASDKSTNPPNAA
ncbi:MAG: IS110 family transposase [Actinobacteria bacterium]|nr:IS110 family transposase [Actinomycetota bacterium]